MTTLELYRKHKKGEIGRDRFLYEVRRDNNLPWITNITSYDDAVKILKNKGIISEAQFEPQNIPTDKAVDHANPYALKREVEKLLAKEKELTNDSYKEALNKAAKKLAGNPQAVKNAMFANAESVAKADAKLQTQEVKKANHKDKHNEMKKVKGQQAPKATAASTKENKKAKKPKGVEVMKDKGVEGSEKVLREAALAELQSFLKKKLNLSEDVHYEYHVGSEVHLPEGGTGKIIEITGGTCTVEAADGTHKDYQMNVLGHAKKKAMEAAAQPAHTQEAKPAEINEEETNVIEEASSVDSIIRALEEAQEQLRDGVSSLKLARKQMLSSGDPELSRIGERIYRYMLGHIEPLIDSEHQWLTNDESIQNIIDNLRGNEGEEDDELDEADDNNFGFQNGDKIKITSELSRYRGATGEIHDLHDDGTAMVILDDPKRTAITVDLGHVKKLTENEEEMDEAQALVVPKTATGQQIDKIAATDPTIKAGQKIDIIRK